MLRASSFVLPLCLLAVACGAPAIEGDPFEEPGATEQAAQGVTCVGAETCSGSGVTWTTIQRAGVSENARGELLQSFVASSTGVPSRVFLIARNLRPITGTPSLHAGIYPTLAAANLDVDGTGALVSGATSLAALPATPVGIPLSGAGALTAGAAYVLRVWTDEVPGASVLVGIGSLMEATYPGGEAYRRTLRRASSGAAWGSSRFRPVGEGDLAFAFDVVVDVNACDPNPCFPGVACSDLPPPSTGFTCGACPVGHTGNGQTCTLAAPGAVTGLRVWYRADAITGVANGGAVASWPDSSSTGIHLSGAMATKPTLRTNVLNGQPVVRFAKGGGLSSSAFVLQNGSHDFTFFFVGKAGATQNTYADILDNSHGANTAGPVIQQAVAGTNTMVTAWWNGSSYQSLPTVDVSTSAFQLHMGRKEGATGAHYTNGGFHARSTISGTNMAQPSVGLMVGGGFIAGRAWDGDLAEVLYYNRALTLSERRTVETYLAAKYGLSTSAPALALSPAPVDFGSVFVAGTSDRTITVTNTGSAPALFGATPFAISGEGAARFSILSTTCANATVAAGATCSAALRFTALAAGTSSASLAAADGEGASAQVSLSGTGSGTNVVDFGAFRGWSDGTYAASCLGYRDGDANHTYAGATGSGVYRIQPAGQSAFDVQCDMTSNGGGWTLVLGATNPTTILSLASRGGYAGGFTVTPSSLGLDTNITCNETSKGGNVSDWRGIPHTSLWVPSLTWTGAGNGDKCVGANGGGTFVPDGPIYTAGAIFTRTHATTIALSAGPVTASVGSLAMQCLCSPGGDQRGSITAGSIWVR